MNSMSPSTTDHSQGADISAPLLILASSSPRRQELVRTFRLPYKVVVSDADEAVEPNMLPEQVVEELSLRKAQAVLEHKLSAEDKPGIVIGSDTIVVLEDRILGKPVDEADAFSMLNGLQGRTHRVYSGVACIHTDTGEQPDSHETADGAGGMRSLPEKEGETSGEVGAVALGDTGQYRLCARLPGGSPGAIVGHTVSHVTFRPMSDEEIYAYIKTGEPRDKAGSYGVQGLGAVFIEKIEGDFYSVMGLPLNMLYQMLLTFKANPFKTFCER